MASVGREAVMFFDRSGRCRYISPSMSKVVGCGFEGATNPAPLADVATEDDNALIDAEARLLARASKTETVSFRRQRDDGAGRPVFLEADLSVLCCPKTGRFEGIAIALRDVSERVRLKQCLNVAQQDKLVAQRDKLRQIAGSGKAIREQMSGVLGSAELLLESDLTPEQQGITKLLDKSARGLLPFLGDLLYFARLEAGEIKAEAQPTDISAVLKESVTALEGAARAKKIEMLVEPETGLPHQNVDGLRLRQILDHLLQSAISRTANASVKLSLEFTSDEIMLSVANSSADVVSVDQAKCFEPFADGADCASALRLPIAHRLALLLGGHLAVRANAATGTRFCLALPRADCEPGEQVEGDRDIGGVAGPSWQKADHMARILLIGAERGRIDDPAEILCGCGFEVNTAPDGEKAANLAIAALAAGRGFDVALVDGGRSPGFVLASARAIRRAGLTVAQLPLLALVKGEVAFCGVNDRKSCVQGALDWPAEAQRLIQAVMRWLPARIVSEDATIDPEERDETWHCWRARALTSVATALASDQLTELIANELAGTMSRLAEGAAERGEGELEARAAALGRALLSGVGEDIQRELARDLLELA